ASPSRLHTSLPSSPPVTIPSPEGWTQAHRTAPSWTSLRAPLSNRTEPSPRAKIAPVLSNRAAVTWASKEKVVMSARTRKESQRGLITSPVASVAWRVYEGAMTLLLIPGFMADATLWDALKDEMTDDLAPFGPLVATDLSRGEDIERMA